MTTDFQKVCAQLQIQRNSFADAHAAAAARAETLAEELDRAKAEYAAYENEHYVRMATRNDEIAHLKAKIAILETPAPQMPPVTVDDSDIPF